jgi:hypothetical protein
MLRIPRVFRNLALSVGMALALVIGASIIPWSAEQPQAAAAVPVSIEQLGRYIDEWSETEGYFDSDNFISNETSYLHVIDDLHNRVRPGGIYLGVGPDQNFSYIAHTRPMLAIITDIRRQNMLEHLFYKALFAMSANRSQYLSFLLSRDRLNVKPNAPLPDLISALRNASTSDALFTKNVATVNNTLTQKYKLKLTADDLAKIKLVYQTFWKEGLDLRFSSIGRNNAAQYPTLEEMFLETNRSGSLENYLASEDQFQWLKRFEAENRLIPIVGDFAGTHALRRVAAFLKSNGLRVSAFYTSNVEFYLFGASGWERFMANVQALPWTDDAVFIRAYFPTYGRRHPLNMAGHRSTTLVQPASRLVGDYVGNRLPTYWDVVKP